ncbi:MAG: LysM peptidoglycan-binding domain-containing protein [Crocinitomicaceae bacterium]|nr:LysM peptidoglycan-binding domain-containing protein [Crocinitomicaceae bacterium]
MNFRKLIIAFATLFFCQISSAQIDSANLAQTNPDSLTYLRFIDVVESSIFEHYKEVWGKEKAYHIIDSLGYEEDYKPTFSDSVYIARLKKLDQQTIIDIEINAAVLSTVKYFVSKRRTFTAVCLGRSKLYFPMYETYLDKYGIPMELKYLSVIESGLRPTVKSRVGATGLWQFMYPTGRMYGLESDSYVDERMNPELATDAACKYLKYLYGLYGDWSLALAAYNAGPGNVNKAIQRSGGKMTYWEVRPFLPEETQMYVPNFIAMLYMMTYYAEHNIVPQEVKKHFYEVDTVCLQHAVRISHVDSILDISTEDFMYLNPVYKTDIIPHTDHKQCITLPIEKISLFLQHEDSLYALDAHLDSTGSRFVTMEKKKTHTVGPNETIVQVAEKYGVTMTEIKTWNNLKTNTIYPGQKLTIMIVEKKFMENTGTPVGSTTTTTSSTTTTTTNTTTTTTTTTPTTTNDGNYKYYALKSGESLWTVSQKFGIPFDKLQEMNKGVDPKHLQPGQKIIIGTL